MGFLEHELAKRAHGQVYGGTDHASVTHELFAGAAGFEAMRMYEHHREREGFTPHHELAKELLAGFVGAEVDKHFESGNFGHLDRERARGQALQQAHYLYDQRYSR
jgi:hypothetical protein